MLNELIFVLKHINIKLKETDLPDLYSVYANTLQAISQGSTPELQNQLKNYRKSIKQAHEVLEPIGWSFSQLKFFTNFGAHSIIGKNAYKRFEDALYANAANTPGAIEAINKQGEEIRSLQNNTSNILSGLGNLANDYTTIDNGAMVQVVFEENVSVENLVDLTKSSEIWQNIIRAYSLLVKEPPERTEILSITKASPMEVILATAPVISKAIYWTIKPLIDLRIEILEAKKHALALEKMKLDVDSQRLDLLKKIDDYATSRIEEIVITVADKHHAEGISEAELNDAKVALNKAGIQLFTFIIDGGKVDASKDPEKSNGNSRTYELEPFYQTMYKLNEDVKKLITERAASNIKIDKLKENDNENTEDIKENNKK